LLRWSPSVSHPLLDRFDSLLRSAVQCFTNTDLSDSQWMQASLSVKDGDLGVRRVSLLALPGYLASAASTPSLQYAILSSSVSSASTIFTNYLSISSSAFRPLPNNLSSKRGKGDAKVANRAYNQTDSPGKDRQRRLMCTIALFVESRKFFLSLAYLAPRLCDPVRMSPRCPLASKN